jgi:capsular exopolysaccharide synthesis family protein
MNSYQPLHSTPPVGGAGTPGSDNGAPALQIFAALSKNWAIIVAVTVLVGVGTVFFTFGQTRVYEAAAIVEFDPPTMQPLGDHIEGFVDMGGNYMNTREYYNTQFWIIRSHRIAQSVVQQLNLHQNAAFLDNAPAGQQRSPRTVSVEDAASRLSSMIDVDPIKGSRLAAVKCRDADPARAQRIATVLVDTYVQYNLDDLAQASNQAADWLHTQIGTLKQDLEVSEMSLHEYKRDKNILSVSMDDQSNMLRAQMNQLNGVLTSIRTKRESYLSRRAELGKIEFSQTAPLDLPASELLNNSTLNGLVSTYIGSQREIEGLTALGKGENHPDMRGAIARQTVVESAMETEVKNIKESLGHDISALERELGGLQRLFDDAEQQALDLNLLEIQYNRLKRNKDMNEKLYALVTERSKESDLTKLLRINNIRVVERPMLPKAPIAPNVPLNIAGGFIAGLVLGLAAAIGREAMDRSIKTPDDAEHELGLSFLGLVPSIGDSQASSYYTYSSRRKQKELERERELAGPVELTVHMHPQSGIAEAARAIRTNIFFMSPDRPYRTLLVTSAGPSEGKTTVACCIAVAMAQAGRRTVLLDCDMRRPRLHRVFGMEKDSGVTAALLDLKLLDTMIHETVVPNLSVVPTGPLPPNPAEILHSESFAKMLTRLRERFDCVVIDSPPVVPVTDSAVLSTAVDGTVLVVRAFKTTKELARRAARSIRDVGGHLVGTVLNAVDLDRHEYGYRYYYYYKREGYASAEVPQSGPGGREGSAPTAHV